MLCVVVVASMSPLKDLKRCRQAFIGASQGRLCVVCVCFCLNVPARELVGHCVGVGDLVLLLLLLPPMPADRTLDLPGKHNVPQSEVIRAIVLEDSSCCGVPYGVARCGESNPLARSEPCFMCGPVAD